jgi:hypothetical protein
MDKSWSQNMPLVSRMRGVSEVLKQKSVSRSASHLVSNVGKTGERQINLMSTSSPQAALLSSRDKSRVVESEANARCEIR